MLFHKIVCVLGEGVEHIFLVLGTHGLYVSNEPVVSGIRKSMKHDSGLSRHSCSLDETHASDSKREKVTPTLQYAGATTLQEIMLQY